MEKESEDSQVPLLDESTESNEMSSDATCHCRKTSSPIRRWTKAILLVTFLLLVYIAVLLTIIVATGIIQPLLKEPTDLMRDRYSMYNPYYAIFSMVTREKRYQETF